MKNLYSGFFYTEPNGTKRHATYQFGSDCRLPEEVGEGDDVTLKVVGLYGDDEVECLIVEVHLANQVIYHQPNENQTVMHVTVWSADGVSPVQSGLRATENGWTPVDGPEIQAKAGFFKGRQ
jgi:hypothetical protein